MPKKQTTTWMTVLGIDGLCLIMDPERELLQRSVEEEHLHYKNGLLLQTIRSTKTLRKSALLLFHSIPIGVGVIDRGYLIQVFVQPKYRKKGFGSFLVQTLTKTFRQNRCRLWSMEGYGTKASRMFWKKNHIIVQEHMGLEISEKEWADVRSGKRSVESMKLQRALEYHLAQGWLTQKQFDDCQIVLHERDQRCWKKRQSKSIYTK